MLTIVLKSSEWSLRLENHFLAHSASTHLPLPHGQLVLQLYEPVFVDVVSTVVDGEDHRSGQQGSWRSTAHHWAQHRLDVLYRGSGKDR